MIGKKISPVLVEIENALWEFEANANLKPQYTDDGFRAALKIFMSAFLDKIFDLQNDEGTELIDRCNMAQKAGEDVRKIIKIYTNIDTCTLYDK
jgi:hypothetical protein